MGISESKWEPEEGYREAHSLPTPNLTPSLLLWATPSCTQSVGWVGPGACGLHGTATPLTPVCAPCSDALALRLACIGDEMDVSLRAPRLAQFSDVAMHR